MQSTNNTKLQKRPVKDTNGKSAVKKLKTSYTSKSTGKSDIDETKKVVSNSMVEKDQLILIFLAKITIHLSGKYLTKSVIAGRISSVIGTDKTISIIWY